MSGEFVFTIATACAPLVALVPLLRLWELRWRVPLNYGADATFYLMLVKDVIHDGTYLTNDRVGAPLGQQLYDFPQGTDNLNILALEALGLFTDDPALAVNVFYLLTYPAVALSAVLVLRHLGLSRPAAFLGAVLFSLLPYHFIRAADHLFLSAYVAVPIGVYLTLVTLAGRPLLRFGSVASELGGARWRTNGLTIIACVVIGSTGLYYAFFAMLLLVAAALSVGVAGGNRAALASGLAAAGIVLAVVALNNAPSLVNGWRNGSNPAALDRRPEESELFGLRLTQLLLPINEHRVDFLAQRSQFYDQTTNTPDGDSESRSQPLGIIGDLGFLALLAVALVACAGGALRQPPRLLRYAAFAVVVAVLYGITAGFSSLFAYAVTPNLHAPGRISVVIAFLALLASGVLVDGAARRLLPARRRERWLFVAIAPLLALGIADQTSDAFVPRWDVRRSTWQLDREFGSALESTLPSGSMVFQLPHVRFPGSGVASRMYDYDHARPYLHTDDLRWSFGAMKGRPEDWAAALANLEPEVYVPAVAAAGFSAIYVDRFGYPDDGRALEGSLRTLLGSPLLESADERQAVFDLRPFQEALVERLGKGGVARLRAATLHPVRWEMGDDFHALEASAEGSWRWSAQSEVDIDLDNPHDAPRSVVFSARIAAATGATVELTYPDGTASRSTTGTEPLAVRRALTIPPGRSSITVSTNAQPTPGAGGDRRTLYLQFLDTRVTDAALCALAPC